MVALQQKHAQNSPRAKVSASNTPAKAEAQQPLQQQSRSSIREKQEQGCGTPLPQQHARNRFVEKIVEKGAQCKMALQFHGVCDIFVEMVLEEMPLPCVGWEPNLVPHWFFELFFLQQRNFSMKRRFKCHFIRMLSHSHVRRRSSVLQLRQGLQSHHGA